MPVIVVDTPEGPAHIACTNADALLKELPAAWSPRIYGGDEPVVGEAVVLRDLPGRVVALEGPIAVVEARVPVSLYNEQLAPDAGHSRCSNVSHTLRCILAAGHPTTCRYRLLSR